MRQYNFLQILIRLFGIISVLAPEAMGEAYDPNNLVQSVTASNVRMSRQHIAGGSRARASISGGGRATPSGMFGARQSVARQPFGGGMQRSPSMSQRQSQMGNMGMQQPMGGGMYNTQPQGMVGAQMQNEQAMVGYSSSEVVWFTSVRALCAFSSFICCHKR